MKIPFGGCPPLTRRTLVAHLKKKGHPAELAQAAIEVIIGTMIQALIQGRVVVFRGFGRFQVRWYQSSRKRLGLIFRPGKKLVARLNQSKIK